MTSGEGWPIQRRAVVESCAGRSARAERRNSTVRSLSRIVDGLAVPPRLFCNSAVSKRDQFSHRPAVSGYNDALPGALNIGDKSGQPRLGVIDVDLPS
jgi:hypothetical protein